MAVGIAAGVPLHEASGVDGEPLLREALELLAARRFDEAIAKAEHALTVPLDGEEMDERGHAGPLTNRARAYYVVGSARCELGDSAGAIAAFDLALKLDASDHVAYSNRAVAKRNAGDVEGALADFTRAIQLRAIYPHALFNRAQLFAAQGQLARADVDYATLLAIAPTPEHRAAWNALRERRGMPHDDAALADAIPAAYRR